MNPTVRRMPLFRELIGVVLHYFPRAEAYVLVEFVLAKLSNGTAADLEYYLRVLHVTQQDAAEGLAQIGLLRAHCVLAADCHNCHYGDHRHYGDYRHQRRRFCKLPPAQCRAAQQKGTAQGDVDLHMDIDANRVLCVAARYGQLDALDFCRLPEMGATHYQQAFLAAAAEGQTSAMRCLLAWSVAIATCPAPKFDPRRIFLLIMHSGKLPSAIISKACDSPSNAEPPISISRCGWQHRTVR